ncbi:hypothetical protein [Draconibacterium sediminis]|uniref:hypothetical protein n=1 Tax=Draconibacterium sediminis TaxID=1544798 RepID=UPI0026F0F5F8|nr:hypothetical protein [Draconibacterium sediminis]
MKLDFKKELNLWGVYFLTIFLSIYVHELGHCIPVWVKGIGAIPTPAKEYILQTIPEALQQQVSLGGILGTVLVTLGIMVLYGLKKFRYDAAVLAGVLAMPGMYTLRFMVVGRGHDATEFQEAQAALGAAYSGHFIDWLFLALFVAGTALWVLKAQPQLRIAGRLLIGFVLTVLFVIAHQVVNNAVFDPMFL